MAGVGDEGDEVGLRVGPGVGEGEAAGVAEAGRMVAGGDADGGGLTVVLPQAATSAAISMTAGSRCCVWDDGHEIGRAQKRITARQPTNRRTRRSIPWQTDALDAGPLTPVPL
jgi:hypothetical protein